MIRRLLVLVFAAAVSLVFSASAGEISPGLLAALDGVAPETPVKAMIFLRDPVDIASLDLRLRLEKTSLAARHATVIRALRDRAEISQVDLLAALDEDKAAGRILGYSPHWIVNGVVVAATRDALLELAARDDVDIVDADLVPALITPVASNSLSFRSPILPDAGLVDHLVKLVWEELGIRGEGALIGSLDTGVDGSHPALAARWRGTSAPWQECWLDLLDNGTTFPVDSHGHGTHTTGTMTGVAADDTIGVAPAAGWIASNAINQNVNSEFDNDIIASLEWFADPDGDPATLDDVPDVVQNSWGVHESFIDYFDCDNRWWDALDACEAAGVVLVWSAGNEGDEAQTVRSPADRATTPHNTFAVGSTSAVAPFTVSSFSSRGPAGPDCGPEENRTKPEITAPGASIYSALPGGLYAYKSGTSMAGPHVAGVVALMRSANPDLDVVAIKQALMDTAVDLGDPGDDNDYGHGFLDAYAAVLAVMDGIGYLDGTVVALDNGQPVPGASVDVIGTPRGTVADANGEFRMVLEQGDYDLAIDAFGFETATVAAAITEGETVDETYQLVRLPTAAVSGTVYDPDGLPAAGAEVFAVETPIPAVLSDGDGFYNLALPFGGTYSIRAVTIGVGVAMAEVVLDDDVTLDLFMEERSQDSFETGDFGAFPWVFGGHLPWQIDDTAAYHGDFSAGTGVIDDDQSSSLGLTMDVGTAGDLSFFYRVSSEGNYDHLEFWVNGERLVRWSGEVAWTEYTYTAVPGHYLFEWIYVKDGMAVGGADAGWIDLVTFPQAADPPAIAIDPLTLSARIPGGDMISTTLAIANSGESPLDFMVTANDVAARVKSPQRAPVVLDKGERPSGDSRLAEKGEGGPDTFGYRWLDSDAADGPVFEWVDIAAVGTPLPEYDDETLGPFELGFTFPFYGAQYTQVRICTNGFITFQDTVIDLYANQGIPNSADPNALVAVLWDDLDSTEAGTIYHYADLDSQRFIVQWDGVVHYGDVSSPETCQVILTADGEIVVQYLVVADDGDCTVGIENAAGDEGLEVLFNSGGYLKDDFALLYTMRPAVPWIDCDPAFGEITGGEEVEVTVTFDATDLADGLYDCDLVVAHNVPEQDAVIVPVSLEVESPTAVEKAPTPFALYGAAPNPFNPVTTLRYSLPVAGHAVLKLYDVRGRLVRTLIDGYTAAGPAEAHWNGRDDDGRRVPSGTYYARLTTAGSSSVKALVMVK